MVTAVPLLVIVALCGSRTPAVKLPEVSGLPVRIPFEVSTTVPVKDAVALFTSWAVTLMLNAVPAVCVPIGPPPLFSTRKWSRGPTVNVTVACWAIVMLSVVSLAV